MNRIKNIQIKLSMDNDTLFKVNENNKDKALQKLQDFMRKKL
jgi:hypothetical protein